MSILNTPNPERIPRYIEVADRFRHQIETGDLCPGEKLPSFPRMLSEHGISQTTVERAYALLEQEGIVVRAAKRGTFVADVNLRPIRRAIGVVWNLLATQDPYVTHLLTGIQVASARHGLEVIFMPMLEGASHDKVGGVIVSQNSDEFVPWLQKIGMPHVFMLKARDDAACVNADEYQGIRGAVEHLLARGHRRIAYLTCAIGKEPDLLSRRRLSAYRDALRASGIAPEDSWIRPVFDPSDLVYGHDSFRDYGREKMARWLRQDWTDLGCTALLAQNDDTAIGAIEALRQAGYTVPRDISVIGFDGTERADYFSPRLTTVQVPLQNISATCIDLLVEQMEQYAKGLKPEFPASRSVILPTALRVGESTGPASRRGSAPKRPKHH